MPCTAGGDDGPLVSLGREAEVGPRVGGEWSCPLVAAQSSLFPSQARSPSDPVRLSGPSRQEEGYGPSRQETQKGLDGRELWARGP